jgi:SET domain-containing protein
MNIQFFSTVYNNMGVIIKVIEVEGTPRLLFFALRDLECGEELLYPYGEQRRQCLEENSWLRR